MPSKYSYDRYKLYRDLKKIYVLEYLKTHPCIDCSETDVRVLDFDHTGEEVKKANVSRLLWSGNNSLDILKAEISKCVVRCANCHRKKTIGSPDWFADFEAFKLSAEQRKAERDQSKNTYNRRLAQPG